MARRKLSTSEVLEPVVRAVLCGAGLLGGLAVGGFVIYFSGLWYRLDRVLAVPLESISANDLMAASVPFAVVLGCAWIGTWVGLRWAAKLGN